MQVLAVTGRGGSRQEAALALTVGERSETENLRPVLGRLREFSDLFLARSETSLWPPTFSDLFWPTSEPSIATHSTGPGIRRRDTRVHRRFATKPQKAEAFHFCLSPILWSELRDTIFSNTGHCGQDYKSEIALRFATHTIPHTMVISDGTQDPLDRLNSSHSERDFSMANNPSPVLGRSPLVRGQRRGQRSAVFSFYS